MDRQGKVVACGTFKPAGIDVWGRLGSFAAWLDRFLREHKPRAVAIEEPLRSDASRTERSTITDRNGRSIMKERSVSITPLTTARALYGFAGVARMICSLQGLPCREVNQRAWRKDFIGVAQAPREIPAKQRTHWLKATAFAQAQRIGAKPDSHDASDAVGVCSWLYGEILRSARAARSTPARHTVESMFRSAAE
ncbi:hypothetical protein [Hansschlegelia plantiphila]|nr:hypothetical protein [Hansschlegelia plantiphila]